MNSIKMKIENITKKPNKKYGPQQLVLTQGLTEGWYYNPDTGQWLYYDPNTGLYVPLASYPTWPYTKVSVSPGDTIRITVSFNYTGPAVSSLNSRWVVGVNGSFGFSEKVYITPTLSISANLSSTPASRTFVQTMGIPSDVQSDWDDIYMKIWGGSPSIGGSESYPAFSVGYNDVLTIVGEEPTITDIDITSITKV